MQSAKELPPENLPSPHTNICPSDRHYECRKVSLLQWKHLKVNLQQAAVNPVSFPADLKNALGSVAFLICIHALVIVLALCKAIFRGQVWRMIAKLQNRMYYTLTKIIPQQGRGHEITPEMEINLSRNELGVLRRKGTTFGMAVCIGYTDSARVERRLFVLT